ncbi:MAG: TetM/TetW/TetO/TetS family tetracycline resistance ribosomal protection protein [Clostridia bacterium]|nr:TetM/TetW/TetO/TetS family tetracycline resistance ribosomal protection protein [Clostridia bacterium]
MKSTVIGIIAHVDAGKTTLSEAMLYTSGAVDRLGRVDKASTHLDTHALERERGITVFSSQAEFTAGNTNVTLIDTPGHIDFSCETERTLAVEDYAVLVVSATDGVTAHTKTLWRLLSARKIPTFIFVNKTDLSTRLRRELRDELRTALSPRCVDFIAEGTEEFYEDVASSSERLMEKYFNTGAVEPSDIAEAILSRRIFPCFFGSALKLSGVRELLSGLDRFTVAKNYPTDMLGARVFKIMRDKNGRRVTFLKVTGGKIATKDIIELSTPSGAVSEKVEEIRVFSAERSRPVSQATAGDVVGIYGLNSTAAGMGIGFEPNDTAMLAPALNYRIILPEGASPYEIYLRLGELAEEEPSLSLSYIAESSEIRVSLMGEIQLEVLRRLILDRLGVEVSFDEGKILYRETVASTVRGAGHFEPIGHYAEVHIEIEPLPEGSGVVAATDCDRDILALNWQRLIMTHIEERRHKGVLVGAPLTDVRITVKGGRAHNKHTEGGDFRQATYRAVRQALMKAECVLLEPTFDFTIEVPVSNLGRVITDISNMSGRIFSTDTAGGLATVIGNAPVLTVRSYPEAIRAFTRGEGSITLTPAGYAPAHNSESVIAEIGYNAELDERHPAGSVFCRAGAGYSVPWYEADEKMHAPPQDEGGAADGEDGEIPARARAVKYGGTLEEDKELMRIFEATYGKPKKRTVGQGRVNSATEQKPKAPKKQVRRGEDYVIIDGYNVIHAWGELKAASEIDFSLAREALIRLMCSYSAFKRCNVIIVFDAYMVKDGRGSTEKYGGVTVVYTRERQTADAFIERATYEMAEDNYVRVVTSDMEEQFIILGNGAYRVSPKELRAELDGVALEIEEAIEKYKKKR